MTGQEPPTAGWKVADELNFPAVDGERFVERTKSPLPPESSLLDCALIFAELRLFMRRPKGIKTKKSVRKRFKITATGKVLTQRVGRRHLLSGKRPKRRRSLRETKEVHSTDVHRIKASLPWG